MTFWESAENLRATDRLADQARDQAHADTVAAYSVGQQVAIAAWSFLIGFVGLATVFKIRSFKEVIRRGREDRAADKAAARPAPG